MSFSVACYNRALSLSGVFSSDCDGGRVAAVALIRYRCTTHHTPRHVGTGTELSHRKKHGCFDVALLCAVLCCAVMW